MNQFNRATMIGFEKFFNELEKSFKQIEPKFPKYNILKLNENKFAIECALAGYSVEDVDVEVLDNHLIIRSNKDEQANETEMNYVHKGIAKRKFELKFRLSDQIVVSEAKMNNGLLVVELEQIIPEEQKPRKIEIK